MKTSPVPVIPGSAQEKRQKAYRAANRLIVGAGILLAEAGVPGQAPEIKALSAALRAVNRAGAQSGGASLSLSAAGHRGDGEANGFHRHA